MKRRGIIEAVVVTNGLILAAAAAISVLPFAPLPLDLALTVTAGSLLTVAGWIIVHTAKALRGAQ
mgnify:CR=1 FL=1